MSKSYYYVSNVYANGTQTSVPIYANGTAIYRLQANGIDYIHKYANETLTATVWSYLRCELTFTRIESESCGTDTVYGNLVVRGNSIFNSKNGDFGTEINIRNNRSYDGTLNVYVGSNAAGSLSKPWGLGGYSDTTYISGSQVVLTIPLVFSSDNPYSETYEFNVNGSYGFTYTLNYDGYKSGSTRMFYTNILGDYSLNKPSGLNSTATTYLINTTKAYDYSTTGYQIY